MEFRDWLLCKETSSAAVLELALRLCITFTSRATIVANLATNFLKIVPAWSWPWVAFPSCRPFYCLIIYDKEPLTLFLHQFHLQWKTIVFYSASTRNVFPRTWMFPWLNNRLSQALKGQLFHDQGSSPGVSKIHPRVFLICSMVFYHQLTKCQRLVCKHYEKGYQELG